MATSDNFHHLADDVVLLIFKALLDVKGLGSCAAVCRRFRQLVPLVDSVEVRIDCEVPAESDQSGGSRSSGVVSRFLRFVGNVVPRPLQAWWKPEEKKPAPLKVAHHSPRQVLRLFTKLRHLHVILPGAELGVDDGGLLKWYASFGSTLESCVIFGADSFELIPSPPPRSNEYKETMSLTVVGDVSQQRHEVPNVSSGTPDMSSEIDHVTADNVSGQGLEMQQSGIRESVATADQEQEGVNSRLLASWENPVRQRRHIENEREEIGQRELATLGEGLDANSTADEDNQPFGVGAELFTSTELKTRIVWTISSMVAAAARHYLLQQMLAEHSELESLVLTDAQDQGCLRMNRSQLEAFRNLPPDELNTSFRTRLPDLRMNLWYASRLSVPLASFRGATLVTIKQKHNPCRHPRGQEAEMKEMISVLEQPLREGAEAVIRRRIHFLEMNAF